MRLSGYIILTLLVSLLSSTASYGQGKDSVKTSVDDLSLLGECCIRQTGLEKDTTTMGFENRKLRQLNTNLGKQITNLEKQQRNSEKASTFLAHGFKTCQDDVARQIRKNKGFKIGMFTLTPIALAGGIWLGSKLGN